MCDAGLASGHTKVQLDDAIAGDKHPCRHRYRRKQQHDALMGKHHAEGKQQAEHAARGTQGGIEATAEKLDDDQLRDGRADHAGDVVDRKRARTKQALDCSAEHPQGQHVEQQVGQSAVEKPVGHQLPDLEAQSRSVRQQFGPQRPEREMDEQCIRKKLLQQEDSHIGNQQCACNGRQINRHAKSWREVA
ncbi:MAG: hypothetical protein BWZ07_03199 [Alphaproteobacteria bacterium ADurb.BinA280]|nr:MAG: hypothetical protein BWZ07_03199 [Alphaproteobacteria bacterium ADurb.BinA280]